MERTFLKHFFSNIPQLTLACTGALVMLELGGEEPKDKVGAWSGSGQVVS